MVVLEPLEVTIKNFPSKSPILCDVPDFPNEPNRGSHKVPFAKDLFIEASDFKEVVLEKYEIKMKLNYLSKRCLRKGTADCVQVNRWD
jgi:tRNA synthetases class I (E and Q), anti-codon binding domain